MTTPKPQRAGLVAEPRFLLVKRGLYYRPDAQGYTGIKDHAGRYREVDALGLDGVSAVPEDEAPEFSKACFHDLALAHVQQKLSAANDTIEKLAEALRGARSILANSGAESGYCMCGDPVASHNIGSGHAPVDAHSYMASQTVEQIDAALSTLSDNGGEA